jgi:hypothetical protein
MSFGTELFVNIIRAGRSNQSDRMRSLITSTAYLTVVVLMLALAFVLLAFPNSGSAHWLNRHSPHPNPEPHNIYWEMYTGLSALFTAITLLAFRLLRS